MLLNVFLAIAVDNLTNVEENAIEEEKEEAERKKHMQDVRQKYEVKHNVYVFGLPEVK